MYCDGSLADEICGGAYVAYVSSNPGPMDENWKMLAWSCFRVAAQSVTAAELEAAAGAQIFATALICQPQSWRNVLEEWVPNVYN